MQDIIVSKRPFSNNPMSHTLAGLLGSRIYGTYPPGNYAVQDPQHLSSGRIKYQAFGNYSLNLTYPDITSVGHTHKDPLAWTAHS